jgi:hypothetical protein
MQLPEIHLVLFFAACSCLTCILFWCLLLAVASPGYYYAGSDGGLPCPADSYNPGFSRIGTCYQCPSGLVSDPGSTTKLDCSKCTSVSGLVGSDSTAWQPCFKDCKQLGNLASKTASSLATLLQRLQADRDWCPLFRCLFSEN